MRQRGQAFAEYGLIVMLIGIVVIGALTIMGQSVWQLYHNASLALPH